MVGFRAGALASALLASAIAFPAAAQQAGAQSGQVPGAVQGGGMENANVPDATVSKVGTALRQVAQIKQSYARRMQSAQTPPQQEDLSKQARGEAISAITQQGLTVEQYDEIIQAAQKDPTLKQRVLAAANVGK